MEAKTDLPGANTDAAAKITEAVTDVAGEKPSQNAVVHEPESNAVVNSQSAEETKGAATHEENPNHEKAPNLEISHQDNGPAVNQEQVIHPESSQQNNDSGIPHDQATRLESNQQGIGPAVNHDPVIHNDPVIRPESSQQPNDPGITHDHIIHPEASQNSHVPGIPQNEAARLETNQHDNGIAINHDQVIHPEGVQQVNDRGLTHDKAAHPEANQQDQGLAVNHDQITHPEGSQQVDDPGVAQDQAAQLEIDQQDNGLAVNPDQATNLEVDSDEIDSAIGDMDPVSSTASLRSSVFDAIEENGRTYHRYKEGKYLLPNDDDEQERLDLQHHLCLLCLNGRLHLAPTGEKLDDVLDLGTGTGIWAIEFALQHPNANVIGQDLSPIQPVFVPTNCRFEVDDAEDDWTYSHKFDFIHWRMLFSCFKDPAGVIAKAFDYLKPGGYLEALDVELPLQCIDDSLKDTALGRWCPMMIAGASILGKDWTCTTKYQKYMTDAGFVDVQIVKYQWPTNPWAKSPEQKILGKWLQQNLLDGVGAMSTAVFTRGLKMSLAEVELFLLDVRKDIKDRRIHAFFPVHVVIGRKPE